MDQASSAHAFRAARDLLLERRDDHESAYRDFRWPELGEFNWALDWFDRVAAGNDRRALWVLEENGDERVATFAELSARSSQVATWLRGLGVRRGDRVIVMLANQVELW